jgi:hypothetical protein
MQVGGGHACEGYLALTKMTFPAAAAAVTADMQDARPEICVGMTNEWCGRSWAGSVDRPDEETTLVE